MIDHSDLGVIYLSIGIVFSAIAGILLRMNNGIHFDFLSAIAVISMNIAMIMWGMSLRTLELSYAAFLWYAVDAVIVVIVGAFFFKEEMNVLKFISICVVVAGIIGLNFSSANKGKYRSVETEESKEVL